MSNETLYHASIGLPSWFKAPTGRVALRWTFHATQAAQEDRYGIIPRAKTLNIDGMELIEIGVRDSRVSKILYRGALDETRDLCIVVVPEGKVWTVKTVWVNLSTDKHQTLQRWKYAAA